MGTTSKEPVIVQVVIGHFNTPYWQVLGGVN